MRRTVNGAARIFTYDGWKPILEWDQWGNWLAWNIYGAGPDEILARTDATYGAMIYKQDRLGNVVALLNANGNVVEKYFYEAFGKPTVTDYWGGNARNASWYGNRFMFTGREWIPELGIYDYRNRMYHPGIGRFLQTDPVGLQTQGAKLTPEQKALFYGGQAPEAFASTELNLYRYSGDDPVNKSDPLGLVPPADGLVDLPKDVLRSQFKAGQTNAADSSTPAINKDAQGRKVEFRRDGYKKGDTITDGVKKGYWANGPKTDPPDNPNGGERVYITHSDVTGNHRHLPQDKDVADYAKVPSGVTYSARPDFMEVYVPRADGGGRGGTFYTSNGVDLLDRQGNKVPH